MYDTCIYCLLFFRGVGCIFYEMASGRPLFPGSTVVDELHLIFKTLGTPTESSMPGVTSNPEFQPYESPVYKAEPVISIAPRSVFYFAIRPCHTSLADSIIRSRDFSDALQAISKTYTELSRLLHLDYKGITV